MSKTFLKYDVSISVYEDFFLIAANSANPNEMPLYHKGFHCMPSAVSRTKMVD